MKDQPWGDRLYRRLYIEDSEEWLGLGPKAQAVYLALLRKLDHRGQMVCGKRSLERAVGEALGWTVGKLVKEGLDELLAAGFLTWDEEGRVLEDPEFVARETAAKSTAVRCREYRLKKPSATRGVSPPTRGVSPPTRGVSPPTRGVSRDTWRVAEEAERPQEAAELTSLLTTTTSTTTPSLPPSISQAPSLAQGGSAEGGLFGTALVPGASTLELEIRWRVGQVWAMYLEARARFYQQANGRRPGREPGFSPELAKLYRAAILEHDKDLLGPDDRLRWVSQSIVRAAVIGLFQDPWCTGRKDGNRIGVDEGAQYFLEPDRPLRRQKGKTHPIHRYADLYWEAKDAQEQAAKLSDTRGRLAEGRGRSVCFAGGAPLLAGQPPAEADAGRLPEELPARGLRAGGPSPAGGLREADRADVVPLPKPGHRV